MQTNEGASYRDPERAPDRSTREPADRAGPSHVQTRRSAARHKESRMENAGRDWCDVGSLRCVIASPGRYEKLEPVQHIPYPNPPGLHISTEHRPALPSRGGHLAFTAFTLYEYARHAGICCHHPPVSLRGPLFLSQNSFFGPRRHALAALWAQNCRGRECKNMDHDTIGW